MEWRQRSESSSSSGHNSSSTCSGGLYRNMKGVDSVPTPVRDRGSLFQDFSPFKVKKERDFEERLFEQSAVRQKKSAFYLPCYVKPRRRLFETAEEVEVRQNSASKREVWVRLLGFPSDALKDALAKYELVSLKSFERANPILVIYNDEERKRGLLVSSDKNSVTYLDVDTGEAKTASVQQVFEPDGTLLSIPNAAIRCRLEVPNCGSDSDFATENLIPHDWTRTKMRIIKWEAIPTISLSILDPHYDLKPVIVQRRIVPRTVQKLYRTLPGILVPPANTILRNCSVLSHEENNAYIMRNDAPFEIDPDETVSDSPTVPSLRELEQFYLVGDIVCAQYNDLEIRVAIESIERSSILLRSIDSGELYEVNDFRGLKSLSKREPCRTLKVVLPPEYTKIPDDHLEIFLKTGVFDVFFEDSRDPPKVRLFTVHGMEMNVCVGEKSDPALMEKDSDDDTSSTRSSRG